MKRSDAVVTAHLFRQLKWDEIDPAFVRRLISVAHAEDLAGEGLVAPPSAGRAGDVTTMAVPVNDDARADLVAREPLVICGLPLLPWVLEVYGGGVEIELVAAEGESVVEGARLASLRGPSSVLLQAERVLLNFLQHLSGIASETARYVAALAGSETRLLDTRKTTPGWRMLEKYAVARGGGWNHRLGLFDRVMLKDNHLAAEGASAGERLGAAVSRGRERAPDLVIEVEVDRLEQIAPVLEAGADVILLDNFSQSDLVEAVRLIEGRAYTEISGGVTLASLPELGRLGVDFISCGAITHQSRWVDIALDWDG